MKLEAFEGKTIKTIVEEYCSVTITFTDGTFLKLEAEGYEGTHMELTYAQLIRRRSGE
jgi:hypothetical protein